MKFGMNKPNQSAEDILASQAEKLPGATKNRAGGLSYSLDNDSATKLLTMTGGQFFNEPTYYANNSVGVDGLSELAREVVATARAVAGTELATDLLSIAHFLRVEKNIRTTPAILFAIAAGEQKTSNRMVEYAPKILRRADDVLQAFAAYSALYGTLDVDKGGRTVRAVKFPNSFKKALAAALSQFDEYQLLKNDSSAWPRFKDVLMVVDRKANYPVKKELVTYFLTGEVVNAEATPILAARKELAQLKKLDKKAVALAKTAHVTWDILLSQFGNNKAVWETLIDGGRTTLPVMAAVRNLRNIEQAGVSKSHWDKLHESVLSVQDTKMMPFRFIAARKEVTSSEAKSIVDAMLDKSVDNIADVPGDTALFLDVSGSMSAPISAKSTMTKVEAGAALMAIFAKKFGRRTTLGVFGSSYKTVQFSLSDSAYRIYEEIMNTRNSVGHSTDAWLAIDHLIKNKIHVNRIVVMSDMQCYNSYGSQSLQSKFKEYQLKVNSECRMVSIDIGGYGQSTVAKDPKVLLTTGYTESVIKEMLAHEGLLDNGSQSDTPSMDYIRANY